ncbi:TetR/AcrR family transcriptional regulator [Tsuneonella amylolytica]|uniref:TetR/AcrR family transcriptional regulator n=1 Tax=Tsuneonella amylolytica TaxID=2338327 RepID=UPI000EAA03A0|nr:TetR/AcrR family transcriptional regulator [Tsuneonella amylolytica]
MDQARVRNRKLSADDRIDEIVDAVRDLVLTERSLTFGMNEIAATIGSSRALVYVYFESVGQILDELCLRQLDLLKERLDAAGGRGDLLARAVAQARAYFDHLVAEGPVLHFIMRERNADSPLVQSIAPFRAMLRSIASEVAAPLQFTPREALVFVELLSAVPESLADQVRAGTLGEPVAYDILDRLVGDLIDDMRVRD